MVRPTPLKLPELTRARYGVELKEFILTIRDWEKQQYMPDC